ncbi:hypothetical protein ACPBEI_00375 [Latilactobacillus sakei]
MGFFSDMIKDANKSAVEKGAQRKRDAARKENEHAQQRQADHDKWMQDKANEIIRGNR